MSSAIHAAKVIAVPVPLHTCLGCPCHLALDHPPGPACAGGETPCLCSQSAGYCLPAAAPLVIRGAQQRQRVECHRGQAIYDEGRSRQLLIGLGAVTRR